MIISTTGDANATGEPVAPIATNDTYSTAHNTTLTVNAVSGILANDI